MMKKVMDAYAAFDGKKARKAAKMDERLDVLYQELFDDANDHGGLLLVSTELDPFVKFVGFDFEINTLELISKNKKKNKN